jgi:TonB family protein
MTPISKDLAGGIDQSSESRAGPSSTRTQPVSTEIPVLVRGSRRVASVPGQPGKLEHFSEETSTVVVFAQGAVVRLVGSVKTGQLVGLTNRQTGREALCRIVNIKNFPDTRGYVEIEFNHPINGFWPGAVTQEAPLLPAAAKKNGSSPLGTLAEMDAEQKLRSNPKELKAQLLEMAAQWKSTESDESTMPLAETQESSAEASSPSAEFPLSSSGQTEANLATRSEISLDSARESAPLEAHLPPATEVENPDAELESLLQPLHELAFASGEAASAHQETPEPSTSEEKDVQASEFAAAPSPHAEAHEAAPQAAPEEASEQGDLLPEDMWNAGSIVHSNLDRPSAGSSDADMRASEEKTLQDARLAELRAALVTSSAKIATREDDPLAETPASGAASQALPLDSVWNLFRSLNKSVPATAEELEDGAASFKLFASGAIKDVHHWDAESAKTSESAVNGAGAAIGAQPPDAGHSGEEDRPAEETRVRGAVAEAPESAEASEEEPEPSKVSAASHDEDAVDSPQDEDAADQNDDESARSAPEGNQATKDIVPQWHSTSAAPPTSRPWGTIAGSLSPSSADSSTGAQGTMATTPAKRSTGARSVLTHAAATLVVLAAGFAAYHTLRPSVSYLMKPPQAPPVLDVEENAAARDAAVASLSVPPLPADIQARVAQSAVPGATKTATGASGGSGAVRARAPANPSASLQTSDGLTAPQVLTKTLPVMPPAARAAGISGDVILSVVVDTTGRVVTARVVSGPAALRSAALEAVRQWEYEPALENGRPVAASIFVTVNFPHR